MVDIHAHILPGIDDGSANLKISLEMSKMAVKSGVGIIAATPHSSAFGHHNNFWGEKFEQRVTDFRKALEENKIPLKIVPGMEIFGTPEVPELLEEGRMIGLNGSKYPLIDFPFNDYADEATDILFDVLSMGMRPVVAHPERYIYVQSDPKILNQWTRMGCLLQINKGSLLGRFGRNEQDLSFALIERGFAFAVASDAHSSVMRTTWMSEARALVEEEFSKDIAKAIFESNPMKIIKNEAVRQEEPDWF